MRTHTRRLSRHGRAWRLGPSAWRRAWHRPTHTGVSWITVAIAAAAVVLVIAFVVVCVRSMSGSELTLAAAETMPSGTDVALPMSTFADGRARFYRYVTAAGRETRFFVLKSADGEVRAALDACDFCFRQRRGFRQVGDHLICNNCGRTISAQHVSVSKGDCNPVPLERTIDGDRVIVRVAALESGDRYF